MSKTTPYEYLLAVYRYARIPIVRWNSSRKPERFLLTKRLAKAELEHYFTGERVHSRNGPPSATEFFTKWAPWILADRRAKIYYSGQRLPGFVSTFCHVFGVAVNDLNKVRPDLPLSIRTASLSGNAGSAASREIPRWFRGHPSPATTKALRTGKPTFLYVPWIAEHSDALIGRIDNEAYNLLPFDMMRDIDNNETRKAITKFARVAPDLYRRMVIRRLVPMRAEIAGLIVTFDWAPVMRIIVSACQELGIPTILIPHESVFVDREKYYWDPNASASVPLADVTLGWGGLQREIFLERGYPDERFIAVGAPKFDSYFDYRPSLARETFCNLFGLNPERKTILFASQPLDSQLDMRSARMSQRQAITDVLSYCETRDVQLLVRLPPSKDDVLGSALRNALLASSCGAIDDAACYLVSPEETLFHCDVVTSVNSTMLFEGLLLGRPAMSVKYIEFDQLWEKAGIPAARSADEVAPLLDEMLAGKWRRSDAGMAWAADIFGIGKFDGNATNRIRSYLTDIATSKKVISQPIKAIQKLLLKHKIDVVGIASSEQTLRSTQLFLPELLNIRCLKSSVPPKLVELASAEVFLQWGIGQSQNKQRQATTARALGKTVAFVEDGFIRSLDIGLSGEPTLSVIIDETTAYYDATKPSGLERTLQTGRELNFNEIARARAAINQIVRSRVSKYNHAPDYRLEIGRPGKRKILIVDQRYGDQSIVCGLATDETFDAMLKEAISKHPDHDVVVKRHPDAISGGKMGHYPDELPQVPSTDRERVFMMDREINPFALFDIVDDVYVVSSTMGFEALMAGKKVHCYGVPYYSGWGATVDELTLERRTRRRSIEEIFHFAYIESSRYVNPETRQTVEVEELVRFIEERKAGHFELLHAG